MHDQRRIKVRAYDDSFNDSRSDGILESELGYRYRLINDIVMPPYVTESRFELLKSLQTNHNDIAFCSFPKSGSTWLSQIILLLLHHGENPDDRTLRQHMIWAESSWPFPQSGEEIEQMNSPRIFKSHMPHSMSLGGGVDQQPTKFIYIARNPKDVCTSYFHFETGKQWAGGFDCTWDQWFELFMNGQVQRGCWFQHVLSWWEMRDRPNMLFLRYEDLLLDFDAQCKKLASFLGVSMDDALLNRVRTNSSFENMKNDEFSNMHEVEQLDTFYRRGKIGSWREHFSDQQTELMDRAIEKHLGPAELDFIDMLP